MESKRLYRSRDDRMIAVLCAGIARYFDVDPTIVRLLFVLGFFFGVTATLWIYIAMALIVPEEPYTGGAMSYTPPSERPEDRP